MGFMTFMLLGELHPGLSGAQLKNMIFKTDKKWELVRGENCQLLMKS